ncbi:hypothetical protein ACFWOB_27380 [Streptomyces sp. NPDC058420]|uniref:hypothetical protein n=1 Tax=Streptomyces sp. NPDC058420 TaxID=3346489 RepID=UPI00366A307E
MATSQSAGRPLAVRERTGRTTHERDTATGGSGVVGPRTTGHGHTDRAGADGLSGGTTFGGPGHRSGTGPHAFVA